MFDIHAPVILNEIMIMAWHFIQNFPPLSYDSRKFGCNYVNNYIDKYPSKLKLNLKANYIRDKKIQQEKII